MRIVIVGSGSAGRRHARTVREALPDASIALVRRASSTQPLAAFAELGVAVHPTLDDALAVAPDLAIVASPAPRHREAVEQVLGSGADVLVEKPLAATLDDARAIERAAIAAPGTVIVGYHLRWSDLVPALRRHLHDGIIGAPVAFDLSVGQHLDQWRPGVDPRDSVTARRELGGGVLLELSHELDGLRFLLGEAAEVRAELRVDGAPTDGTVETVADLDIELRAGARGRVHLDMVRADPLRRWTVSGSDGRLVADLLAGTIVHEEPSGAARVLHTSAPGERDRAEQRLVDDLIGARASAQAPRCTVADGTAALVLVHAARESARSGRRATVPGP